MDNQPEQQDAQRGTPRGQRGRGARGRASRGRGRGQLPTFAERQQQVNEQNPRPAPQPLPVAALPLDQFSAMLDRDFPVEAVPLFPTRDLMLDPNGYLDVSDETYRTLVTLEPKLMETLSHSEFMMATSWMFAYKVLAARDAHRPLDTPGWLDFSHQFAADFKVPEPIAIGLQNIGTFRENVGTTFLPNLVLPRARTGQDGGNFLGLKPSTIESRFGNEADDGFEIAMLPFGKLERRMVMDHHDRTHPPANIAHYLDRVNPAAINDDDDIHIDHKHSNFNVANLLPPVARRIPMAPVKTLLPRNMNGLLNSVRWNSRVFEDFKVFTHRAEKYMKMVSMPKTNTGSRVLTAFASPMDTTLDTPATHYEFGSFVQLSTTEMHLARLFRYRVRRTRAPDLFDSEDLSDSELVYNSVPVHLTGDPPVELTQLRGITTYVRSFITVFVKH